MGLESPLSYADSAWLSGSGAPGEVGDRAIGAELVRETHIEALRAKTP